MPADRWHRGCSTPHGFLSLDEKGHGPAPLLQRKAAGRNLPLTRNISRGLVTMLKSGNGGHAVIWLFFSAENSKQCGKRVTATARRPLWASPLPTIFFEKGGKMEKSLEKGLAHLLNTHGYSFQYAVIKAAISYFEDKSSPWRFEVAEFPVEVNDKSTHIDFILKNINESFYMVAECKRVNPALKDWCFVKAPYVSRKLSQSSSSGERIVREVINSYLSTYTHSAYASAIPPQTPYTATGLQWFHRSRDIYRLAFEVKSGEKGEGQYGRGQINEAITQVLTGLNGILNFASNTFDSETRLFFGADHAAFMPVIFTNASLWVTEIDLSEADLESGNVDIDKIKLEPREWLFYHYDQSPGLKHSVGFLPNEKIELLSDYLYFLYTRTIPIVNESAILNFLSDGLWSEPVDWHPNENPAKS
jgi:hypothetical protein